ncbi:hypothetical protein GRI72_09320 [Altererythrobacter marinus]|uniref:JAB domain-containing protein n=1 Tax=Pelagerythrobacter marinus TaxID=538382 RepID=A0ABW9UXX0_9SPHN|nr:hypothetical protein [Pelagerythrobacter marinus]
MIEQIQSSCRKCAPSEAGGLLLGYRKGIDFEVIAATLPNQWDRASSARFVRSVRGHRIRALREWKKSQGSVDWIGEWHSHPHGALRPSYIDLTNWKKLRTQTGKEMVFAIVGFNDLGLWLQSRPLGRAVHLDLKLGDDAGSLFEVKK